MNDCMQIKVTVAVDHQDTIHIWGGNLIRQIDRRDLRKHHPPIVSGTMDSDWFTYYRMFKEEWHHLKDGMVICVTKSFHPYASRRLIPYFRSGVER